MNAYRKNVGIIPYDHSGNVLLFERADHLGSWQFPQGGIESGEDALEAAYRELYEETGITRSSIESYIAYPTILTYNFPSDVVPFEGYAGQAQQWYFFRVDSNNLAINLHIQDNKEFRSFKWTSFQSSLNEVVLFKRPVYEALNIYFKQMSAV